MKPHYIYAMVVLLLVLGFTAVGVLLIHVKWIRAHQAPGYTRISTLLILYAAYAMDQYGWPGVHLRPVDFWSLMVMLGIAGYALIWGALAYQLNHNTPEEFGESFMLSMLYSDSEHPTQQLPDDKKARE